MFLEIVPLRYCNDGELCRGTYAFWIFNLYSASSTLYLRHAAYVMQGGTFCQQYAANFRGEMLKSPYRRARLQACTSRRAGKPLSRSSCITLVVWTAHKAIIIHVLINLCMTTSRRETLAKLSWVPSELSPIIEIDSSVDYLN